ERAPGEEGVANVRPPGARHRERDEPADDDERRHRRDRLTPPGTPPLGRLTLRAAAARRNTRGHARDARNASGGNRAWDRSVQGRRLGCLAHPAILDLAELPGRAKLVDRL